MCPINHFRTDSYGRPYSFVADSFHAKKLCRRLSSSEVRFYTEIGRFVFEHPFVGLRAMYDDHLRLIGKHVLDVLLVFFGFFSLGVMAEALRVNIGSKSAISLQWRPVDPKFQVEGVAPTNHCSSQKTRLTDLSWCKSLDRSFFHLVTIHAFDRRTDGRTEFSSLDRVCIPCSAVKLWTDFSLFCHNPRV